MDFSFIQFIKSVIVLPTEQEEKIRALLSTRRIVKEENFISEGQHPKTIAFVKNGFFRYYYSNEEGEEFTKSFFQEGTVISSYSAMEEGRESHFTIQALEDSEIEEFEYASFQKLLANHPCWTSLLFAMIKKGFMVKEERERQFLLFDAERRYLSFLDRFPELDKRVKQHIIASYLRVTPESLSRLRRKMGLLS